VQAQLSQYIFDRLPRVNAQYPTAQARASRYNSIEYPSLNVIGTPEAGRPIKSDFPNSTYRDHLLQQQV
jgi:hypothetical protein